MRGPRRHLGFTLLELLIAIGLLALLLGAIGTYAFNVLERRQELAREMFRLRLADALIDGLEEAALTSIATGADGSAGIRGSATDIRIAARSVWFSDEPSADPVVFSCSFDEASEAFSMSRESGGASDSEDNDGVIARLQLRYWDGNDWQESFDSARQGLPGAIEVAIWFDRPFDPEAPEPIELDEDDEDASGFEDAPAPDLPWGAPDRVRVIAVPDGGTRDAGGTA